ncbi:unnamed protein product [Protopolystoma xenopodis]|uniref:Uncharacterized protein n=1 Tax=Protopolystoma xenopodis TaxID=117903 RepID=A0A3S4ZQH9_9PLAT|nr:unnamed protein product [Protopolystoma xenopodis]
MINSCLFFPFVATDSGRLLTTCLAPEPNPGRDLQPVPTYHLSAGLVHNGALTRDQSKPRCGNRGLAETCLPIGLNREE